MVGCDRCDVRPPMGRIQVDSPRPRCARGGDTEHGGLSRIAPHRRYALYLCYGDQSRRPAHHDHSPSRGLLRVAVAQVDASQRPAFVVLINAFGPPLPYVLPPGARWTGAINQDDLIKDYGTTGRVYCGVIHSHSKKAVYRRVRFK